MSVLYQIGVIDKCTAGWGTIWVAERQKTTYLFPANPVEAMERIREYHAARKEGEDG